MSQARPLRGLSVRSYILYTFSQRPFSIHSIYSWELSTRGSWVNSMYGLVFPVLISNTLSTTFLLEDERKANISSRFDAIKIIVSNSPLEEPWTAPRTTFCPVILVCVWERECVCHRATNHILLCDTLFAVCWRILAYADVCRRRRASGSNRCFLMLLDFLVPKHLLF